MSGNVAAGDSIPGFSLGGAVLRRPLSIGGKTVPAGTTLSREAFLAMKYALRRVLLNNGHLMPIHVPEMALTQRHIVHRGSGRYDVVQGIQLNKDPLSRDAAEELGAQSNPIGG